MLDSSRLSLPTKHSSFQNYNQSQDADDEKLFYELLFSAKLRASVVNSPYLPKCDFQDAYPSQHYYIGMNFALRVLISYSAAPFEVLPL